MGDRVWHPDRAIVGCEVSFNEADVGVIFFEKFYETAVFEEAR